MPRRALALLAVALVGAAAPTDEAPGEAAEVASAAAEHAPKRSWFALPMLFWLPETKLGLAGTGGLHFRIRDAPSRSNVFLVAGYTAEEQGSIDLASEVYLPGRTVLSGRFRAVHYPDAFYGIGPAASADDREEYTRRFLELNATAEFTIGSTPLRAGPRLNARAEEFRDVRPGGLLASSSLAGVDGFNAIGFGASVTWDTRDRPLWPLRGALAQASYLYFPAGFARSDGFGKGSFEARLFQPLGRERVLGVAALIEHAHGETPFSILPKLGSTRFLRGYREGRFRDQLAWAAQAELRVPLADRVFGAAFGGFGDVGPDLASLRADTLKFAGGVGVRYRLTDEGANLRLDVAASEAGPEVYLLLLEAF